VPVPSAILRSCLARLCPCCDTTVKKDRGSKHASKDDQIDVDGASDDRGSMGTSRREAKRLKSDDHSNAPAAEGSDVPAFAADTAALIATVNYRFDAISVGITTQGENIGHLWSSRYLGGQPHEVPGQDQQRHRKPRDPRNGAMLKHNIVMPTSLAERARGRALEHAWRDPRGPARL
jgi:hypothetical protein